MRIAIIGAGFFGLTLGLFLSKKYKVEIFEKRESIFKGASSANQFRFHYGYHYPRSQKTVKEINKSKDILIDKNNIPINIKNYIFGNNSKTNNSKSNNS